MFRVFVVSLVCLFPLEISYCQTDNSRAPQQTIDGEYVALEKMPNLSADDSREKWFHENTMLVRNNEAILDMAPVYIKGGKKFYSASDGGFLTYRARFFYRDGESFLNLRLFRSDYVAFRVGSDPYSEIKTRRVKFGAEEIYIEGVRYRRKAIGETKRKELLRLLDGEPLEKPASR